MVIAKQFAWVHIPKTGGDITAAYFRLFEDELGLSIDPIDTSRKHATFAQRGVDCATRRVANIRRLPSLFLSHIIHMQRVNGLPPMDLRAGVLEPPANSAGAKPPLERNNLYAVGDEYIDFFTDGGRLGIDTWLRCERILDDLVAFVSGYTRVTPDHLQALQRIAVKSLHDYDHDVRHHWTRAEIRRMYALNPRWADAELRTYGTLLA
jgi:hypothetical protein